MTTTTQADRDVVLEISGATRWYPDGDLIIRAVDALDLTVAVVGDTSDAALSHARELLGRAQVALH